MTGTIRELSKLSQLLAAASAAPANVPTKPKKPAPAPANDNRAPDVLAWPTIERLAHRGDEARVYALRHWRNLCFPGSGYIQPEPTGEDTEEAEVEVRPSESELLRAVGWTVTDRERWPHTGKLVNVYYAADLKPTASRNRNGGVDTQLGELLFRDGALIEWGRTGKGRALRPVERARGVKGSAPSERSESAVWNYIKAPATTPSPFAAVSLRRPFSGEPAIAGYYEPLPGVEEARTLLREHGVDGSVAFADLPVAATRCGDGLIAGPQWVGGVKKPKPLGEISAAAGREPKIVRLIEGADHLTHLRSLLRDHARVLDLAIGDATAKEIGVAMGKAPAYAEKAGPHLIDAAIDALIAADETARLLVEEKPKKIAA